MKNNSKDLQNLDNFKFIGNKIFELSDYLKSIWEFSFLEQEKIKNLFLKEFENDYLEEKEENFIRYSPKKFDENYLQQKLFALNLKVIRDFNLKTHIIPEKNSLVYNYLKEKNPKLLVDLLNFIIGKRYFLYDINAKEIKYIGPGTLGPSGGGSPTSLRVDRILKNQKADDYKIKEVI